MDSFELNKIAGAVLLSLLVVMGLGVVSDLIFETNPPEIPGYEIAVATDHGEGEEPAESAEPEVVPIGTRLVEASAESGEKAAKKCAACHSFEQGGPNKVGPALWGVVGRTPGSHDGFGYSGAMTEFASSHDAWTYEQLDHFLTNPRGYIDGTTMSFAGIKKPEDRADVIAYLRSLSDNPEPLPTE
ncbi:cytochrome c family protein [Rhizobiales bacterium]|uniref:c-type cytochrome n=1 Tax=Hongsoonwoonella zoysiae TaxID=2821844 RepID=UPI00155FEC3F|nr:cytochrome c family protein [Hongsoonwoonella zoysiae]NRG16550.1 cytochrome c family protein [Hongsoonwoonella zoysiae]